MNSLILSSKPDPVVVVCKLVKRLKIAVNYSTVEKDLEQHPEFPSLLAISDCLTSWNVPHEAFKINKSEYKQEELPCPFIAHLNLNGGEFILVQDIDNGKVEYSDGKKNNVTLTESDFLEYWDGVILYAEPNAQSGEVDYKQNRLKYTLQDLIGPAGIILLLSVIYLTFSVSGFSWPFLFLNVIKLAGVLVSILLLIQSINSDNPFIQNLCGLGGKNDCNAILKSDASKLTSWLSWSEIGFFYFTGSALLLLLNPASISLLAWLNLFSLPYTIYSIVYQYRSKNWCVLCCSVQVLLWLEFVVFLSSSLYTLNFSLSFIVPASFLIPIISWAFLKPFFLEAAQLKPLQQQLKKFKYNNELFQQALTNQARYALQDELMPIILGNPLAETIITMVSNPYCSPCGKAHATIEAWLKTRDDLQLKIVFTNSNQNHDPRTKFIRHLVALDNLREKNIVEQALNDWYTQSTRDYDAWAERYPVEFDREISSVTEKQKAWCELADITFTPTILINGYKLPEPYSLADIKYLIN